MKENFSKKDIATMLDEGLNILICIKKLCVAVIDFVDTSSTSIEKMRDVTSKKETEVIADNSQPLEVFTKEDVRGLLAKKTTENDGAYKEDVKALVKKYANGGSFKDVKEKDYSALLKDLEEVGNE